MLALTIKQPWASLILHHGKDIENRKWVFPDHMRGQRIAIHASKRLDHTEYVSAVEHCHFSSIPSFDLKPKDLPLGKIIGTIELETFGTNFRSPWFTGPIGWKLKDPIALLEPIPAKGALGLWTIPSDIADEIERQLVRLATNV